MDPLNELCHILAAASNACLLILWRIDRRLKFLPSVAILLHLALADLANDIHSALYRDLSIRLLTENESLLFQWFRWNQYLGFVIALTSVTSVLVLLAKELVQYIRPPTDLSKGSFAAEHGIIWTMSLLICLPVLLFAKNLRIMG